MIKANTGTHKGSSGYDAGSFTGSTNGDKKPQKRDKKLYEYN